MAEREAPCSTYGSFGRYMVTKGRETMFFFFSSIRARRRIETGSTYEPGSSFNCVSKYPAIDPVERSFELLPMICLLLYAASLKLTGKQHDGKRWFSPAQSL